MIVVTFEFIPGLTIGLEHHDGDEDDPYNYLVPLSLGIFRIIFLSMKEGFTLDDL
jgi:hypothetical protein